MKNELTVNSLRDKKELRKKFSSGSNNTLNKSDMQCGRKQLRESVRPLKLEKGQKRKAFR